MKPHSQAFWISFWIISYFCTACRQPGAPASVLVIAKNDKAIGLAIRGLHVRENDLSKRIVVQLIQPRERTAVLGEFKVDKGEIIFEPHVPFTSGLDYQVLLDDSLLSVLKIPKGESEPPELLSIYPTQDTLPENLLKMYLHFSQPMVEGRSLSFITLMRNEKDTMPGTFLDLQPELWNAEGTVLTIWLDPGRIKRDLIPNQQLGSPLKSGSHYTLHVSGSWKSKNGHPLSKNYSKNFSTVPRDDDPPDPSNWKIIAPSAGTKQLLRIQIPEPLDNYILQEGLQVINAQGDPVTGTKQITNEEQIIKFFPDKSWRAGTFALQIEARLEDLAGNNLNRPFERDLLDKPSENDREIFTKEFKIK